MSALHGAVPTRILSYLVAMFIYVLFTLQDSLVPYFSTFLPSPYKLRERQYLPIREHRGFSGKARVRALGVPRWECNGSSDGQWSGPGDWSLGRFYSYSRPGITCGVSCLETGDWDCLGLDCLTVGLCLGTG